jgi:hypothetical protein
MLFQPEPIYRFHDGLQEIGEPCHYCLKLVVKGIVQNFIVQISHQMD